MSYSGLGLESGVGLGRGLGQPPSGAPLRTGPDAANPMDTGGIVPAACDTLSFYTAPPRTIQPTQTLVVAYPYVLGDPEEQGLVLAEILGAEGEGGDSLLNFLVTSPDKLAFVGGGWMRDTKSVQSVSKGTLYLALRPKAAISRALLERYAELLLINAIDRRGTLVTRSNSSRLGPRINLLTRWSTLANGDSDDELRQAAYTSAGAGAVFGAFIRTAIQQAPRITRQAAQLGSEFAALSRQLQGAQRIVMTIDQIVGASDGAIATAMGMSRDQAAEAVSSLDVVRRQLEQALILVRTGTAAAPAFAQSAGERRIAVLTAARAAVLGVAESAIQRGAPLELAREFYRCVLLKQAKRSIDSTLDAVNAALDQGSAAALWLLNNAANIETAMQELSEALERVEAAIAEIPLGWLLRTRWGLPVWGWLGVGGTVFVGGAFGLRALKKRRKRKVKSNRRRLPRRTSR